MERCRPDQYGELGLTRSADYELPVAHWLASLSWPGTGAPRHPEAGE